MKKKLHYLIILLITNFSFSQIYQIDNTFNIGDGFNDSAIVEDIEIQNDGKILVIGSNFNSLNNITISSNVIRLNSDGTIDTEFANIITEPKCMVIQSDGKIIVAGNSSSNNTRIIRFNSDGSQDNTFSVGVNATDGFNDVINKIDIDNNGRVIVFGDFTEYSGNSVKPLVRLNANGSLYFPFSAVTFTIRGFELLNSGKILVSEVPNLLKRLNADGTLDNTYNTISGKAFNIFYESANGDFFSATKNQNSHTEIYKINANGSINNSTFNTYTITDVGSSLSSIKELSNGQILLSVRSGGTPESKLILLNSDGFESNQNNFGSGFGFQYARDSAIQNDYKILLGGNFNSYNGITKFSLVRLVNNALSIEEVKLNNISIYPNPVNDKIKFSGIEINSNLIYKIYDLQGKVLQKGESDINEINVNKLNKGIYILRISDKQQIEYFKFVKK